MGKIRKRSPDELADMKTLINALNWVDACALRLGRVTFDVQQELPSSIDTILLFSNHTQLSRVIDSARRVQTGAKLLRALYWKIQPLIRQLEVQRIAIENLESDLDGLKSEPHKMTRRAFFAATRRGMKAGAK